MQADLFLARNPLDTEPQKSSPAVAPTGQMPSSSTAPRAHQEAVRGSQFLQLWLAVKQGRLVVAKHEGFGTLLEGNSHFQRNADFRFRALELLVVHLDEPARNGHKNVVVEKCNGPERGHPEDLSVDRTARLRRYW